MSGAASGSRAAPPFHHPAAPDGPPPRAGEDFGNAAGRLAGIAGALFGWRPDDFWRATPAELGAIVAAVTGDEGGAAPPDAATIAALREAFPDG